MTITIKDTNGDDTGTTELPQQFTEPIRPDIIKRAVLAHQSDQRQPYGAKPDAGKRHSARISKKRRDYRGSYGYGISRVPRKILTRRGRRMNWEGAVIPGTVGGRRAHPPKAEKDWSKDINDKERRKALRSALHATLKAELATGRGHNVPDDYPFLINDDFEDIKKTQELITALTNVGLADELERTEEPKERSGQGTTRGRKRRYKTGILLVVSDEDVNAHLAGRNIPGVDVKRYDELNAETLAPGTTPGRLTLYTTKAIERIEEDEVYT